MSETLVEPGKVRLYTWGQWSRAELPAGADPTPLGQRLIDYLQRKYTGPLTEREAELVREEFEAQETYRSRLVDALMRCSGKLQHEAAAKAQEMGGPFRLSEDPNVKGGSYNAGYVLGQYTALAGAAQMVQDVVNMLSVQTHTDNEALTAARKAKLEAEGSE